MTTVVNWTGESGTAYTYHFIDLTRPVNEVPVNYAFVRQLANGNFTPLYFGEAENFKARLANHERWAEAVQLGATHVMAHTTQGGVQARCAEEADVIRKWNPPMNVQHRKAV